MSARRRLLRIAVPLLALATAVLLHEFWISRLELDQALAIARSGEARGDLSGTSWSFDSLLQSWEYRTSREVLERLADDDNPRAMFYLGKFHYFGYGMDEDRDIGFRWRLAAALGGYEPAYLHTGFGFAHGRGTNRDPAEAERWYQKAIEANDERGYARLADLLLRGERTPADVVRAATLLDQGIDDGDQYAAERKIDALLDGILGPVDMNEIVELHKWLALRGDTDAMESLISILNNTGLTAFRHPEETARTYDPEAAYMWTLVAMSHWTDTENSYFDPASYLPRILLHNYPEFLAVSIGPTGWNWDQRQPVPRPPKTAAQNEAEQSTAEARQALVERANRVLSDTTAPLPLPEIANMPYAIDSEAILRAERDAVAFLKTKPFGAD